MEQTEDDVVMVQIKAPRELVERLDRIAGEESRTRSSLLRYLIENLPTALAAIHKERS